MKTLEREDVEELRGRFPGLFDVDALVPDDRCQFEVKALGPGVALDPLAVVWTVKARSAVRLGSREDVGNNFDKFVRGRPPIEWVDDDDVMVAQWRPWNGQNPGVWTFYEIARPVSPPTASRRALWVSVALADTVRFWVLRKLNLELGYAKKQVFN